MPMPGIRLGVRINTKQLDTLLARIKLGAGNAIPVFQAKIDPSITEFFAQEFEARRTNGADSSMPWAPNTPTTVRLKGRRGHGRMGTDFVGQDTRTLWASLAKHTGPQVIKVFTPHSFERGTSVRSALFMQEGWESRTIFGKPKRTVRVPPRQLVPDQLPQPLVAMWEGALEQFIIEGKL